MTSKIIAVFCLVLVLSGVAQAQPARPSQPYPITNNDPAFVDRQVREIYSRLGAYIDTLNQLRRDTANAALAKVNLYDDTASQALQPLVHSGLAILSANQVTDTVIIKDISGNTVSYPCDSCYSVFISPVHFWWDSPTTVSTITKDSLFVGYKSSGTYQQVSASSFAVHKLYGQVVYIYWMTVRRK